MTIASPEPRAALEVEDLVVEYRRGRIRTTAVDGINFSIGRGETVGVVGESGSGKTSVARAVLGLLRPTQGVVSIDGEVLPRKRDRRALAGRLQVVFQDPYSSIDPAQTVGQVLAEALAGIRVSRSEIRARVRESLEAVGLDPHTASRYPNSFSGGQRQRIAIARALMRRPEIIVCDESLSALDLSIQAQIVNLLLDLQREHGISYLFIAHDLTIVRHMCQRVVVMYRGRLVESGTAEGVYTEPGHPYTQALLAAAPVPDPVLQRQARQDRVARNSALKSDVASEGCPFAQRCPFAIAVCFSERPPDRMRPDGGTVACHRYPEVLTLDPTA